MGYLCSNCIHTYGGYSDNIEFHIKLTVDCDMESTNNIIRLLKLYKSYVLLITLGNGFRDILSRKLLSLNHSQKLWSFYTFSICLILFGLLCYSTLFFFPHHYAFLYIWQPHFSHYFLLYWFLFVSTYLIYVTVSKSSYCWIQSFFLLINLI